MYIKERNIIMIKIKEIVWNKDQFFREGEAYLGKIGDKIISVIELCADGRFCLSVFCHREFPVYYYEKLEDAKTCGQQIFNEFIKSVTEKYEKTSAVIIRDVDSFIEQYGKDLLLRILCGNDIGG